MSDNREEQLKQELQELEQMKKELQQRLENIEERERRQDILRSIADSVGLNEKDHFMATEQPSNRRFNKEGLKEVDRYIKDLENRVQQLLNKVDSREVEEPIKA